MSALNLCLCWLTVTQEFSILVDILNIDSFELRTLTLVSPQPQTMSVLINKLQRSAEDGFHHSSRELSRLLACILTFEYKSGERVFKISNTMVNGRIL